MGQRLYVTEVEGLPLKAPTARNPPLANGGTIPERTSNRDLLVHMTGIVIDGTHLFNRGEISDSSATATCSIIISCVSMGSSDILRDGPKNKVKERKWCMKGNLFCATRGIGVTRL